jgi:hypothetical protein
LIPVSPRVLEDIEAVEAVDQVDETAGLLSTKTSFDWTIFWPRRGPA